MIIFFLAIFIVVCALVSLLQVGRVGFNTAIARGREIDITNRESLSHSPYDTHYDEIIKGLNFINSLPYEDVYIISRDNLKLHGRLVNTPNAKGTVIIVHSYRSHPEIDFSVSSNLYYELGLNLLFVDQRASGQSEGSNICFGIKERLDCVDWANYANDGFSSGKPIILAGISMGAATVLMASADKKLPDTVCAIIADSPFTSPAEIIEETIVRILKGKRFLAKVATRAINLFAKMRAGFSLYQYSTIDAMKDNTIPIFIAHEKGDKRVPAWMGQKTYEACNCKKELLICPGDEHGTGYITNHAEYTKRLIEFINTNLQNKK